MEGKAFYKNLEDLINRQKEDLDVDLNIMNRQNDEIWELKAEIDRLKVENESLRMAGNSLKIHLKKAEEEVERLRENKIIVPSRCQGKTLFLLKRVNAVRAEAIKEFAERVKERKYLSSEWSHGEHPDVVEEDEIDDLVEEMTGEENDD